MLIQSVHEVIFFVSQGNETKDMVRTLLRDQLPKGRTLNACGRCSVKRRKRRRRSCAVVEGRGREPEKKGAEASEHVNVLKGMNKELGAVS